MSREPPDRTQLRVGRASPPPDDVSPLAAGYRRWLRVLPAPYRAVREQEMVEAYVNSRLDADPEVADATVQASWPGLREVASVVALALRLRWADPEGPRRYVVTTAALRGATLTGLTVLGVLAVTSLLGTVLLVLDPPANLTPPRLLFGAEPGVWSLLSGWSYLLWVPALVLALARRRRGAQWAAVLSAVPAAVGLLRTLVSPAGPALVGDWLWLVVQAGVVAGLAAMATTPPASSGEAGAVAPAGRLLRSRVLIVAGVLLAWTFVVVAISRWAPSPERILPYVAILDISGVWCLATLVVTVTLIVHRLLGRQLAAAELLGLAFVAGAALLLRAAMLPVWFTYAGQGGPSAGPILASALVQLAVDAVITGLAGTLAVRRLRRLPPVSYLPARR